MNYEPKYIDSILDLYWEGETSISQEVELRAYFASDQVEGKHEVYRPLFQYYAHQSELSTSIDVEAVLAELAPSEEPKSLWTIIRPFRRYTMGIAAAMTLTLSVVTVMQYQASNSSAKVIVLDEEAETEEALRITREALALLSSKIDKSSQQIQSGMTKMKSASILK